MEEKINTLQLIIWSRWVINIKDNIICLKKQQKKDAVAYLLFKYSFNAGPKIFYQIIGTSIGSNPALFFQLILTFL